MIIDSAIKTFLEKYDREAIDSINNVSKDLGAIHNKYTIKGFNINEAFNKFQDYIKGYASYKIENINNPDASPQSAIIESVQRFIDTQLFEEKDLLYPELPTFVESYVNGIESLISTIEDVKHTMMESDIDGEYIGNVNEFADKFMIKLHESFDPVMDKILWASGYNSKRALSNAGKVKSENPVFL